MKNVTIVCY